jgi:hypothetical protein
MVVAGAAGAATGGRVDGAGGEAEEPGGEAAAAGAAAGEGVAAGGLGSSCPTVSALPPRGCRRKTVDTPDTADALARGPSTCRGERGAD